MDDYRVQEEMKKAMGISGLFSRKKAVENVVSYFEKNGEREALKKHVGRVMRLPEYQLLEEIPVEDGFESPTVLDELDQRYGITLDPSNFLKVKGEKVAVVYGKDIIPIKGQKQNLRGALTNIMYLQEENNLGERGNRNPFVRTFKNLDSMPEFDPWEERRKIEEVKEYRKLQTEQKILEEVLPNVEIEETRRFGIFPTKHLKFNVDYDKLFYNHLGDYSPKEKHEALIDLEKDAQGNVKEKVKALKGKFEREESIYSGRHFTNGSLAGLLIASVIIPAAAIGVYTLSNYFNNNGNNNHNPPPTTKDNFLNFATANNITRTTAENFYGNYTADVNNIYPKNSSLLLPEIKLFSQDPAVYAELHRNISQDPRITIERDALMSSTSQLFSELGLYGKVKTLNPGTNSYRTESLIVPSIQAASNATMAAMQRNLPLLSRDSYSSLINKTQNDPATVDFSKIIVPGNETQIDLWKDANNVDLNCYTAGMDLGQNHYVLNQTGDGEFFNGLLRQHNLVLDKIGLNPTNETTRLTYAKPDIDYYYQYLPTKKIVVNGTEITFPLLPFLNETKMKEWFPEKSDRAVIYASQYPVQLTFHNVKTGEYRDNEAQGWTQQYGQKALLDGLNLVWNGGKWGKFEGKLVDRITKAYTDKEWDSYYDGTGSDHILARYYYDEWELNFFKNIFKDFEKPITEFQEKYDPKLASDVRMDLGFRFGDIAALDVVRNYNPPLPHQYRTFLHMLNSKALGYSGIEVWAEDPSNPYSHEKLAGAVPKYLFDQLPSGGRYAPGKMISEYVYGFDSSGRPLELTAWLPTGETIEF